MIVVELAFILLVSIVLGVGWTAVQVLVHKALISRARHPKVHTVYYKTIKFKKRRRL